MLSDLTFVFSSLRGVFGGIVEMRRLTPLGGFDGTTKSGDESAEG